jgi:hypothetical protein
MAKGETVTQQNGVGPFKVFYVKAADDPMRKTASQNRPRS